MRKPTIERHALAMPVRHPAWHWWSFMIVVFATLTALSAQRITGDSIKGDATQNLRIAYHLFHGHGFTLRSPKADGASVPTNFREPVPPLFTAAYLRLVLPTDRVHDFPSWHHGPYTRLVKLGNLFWVFTGMVGFHLLAELLLRGRAWAVLASAGAYLFFFQNPQVVDSLYTELEAGTLMVWSAVLLALGLRRGCSGWFMAAGLTLGALTLTKNVFQTVGPAVALLALIAWVWRAGQPGAWKAAALCMALPLFAAFVLVVAPWIVRNQVWLGTSELSSGRSGYVMYKRALMDRMNDDEFRLAFHLYGPPFYGRWVEGTSLAIVYPEDMRRGGRLQRLNPYPSEFQQEDNQAIYDARPERSLTFYRQAAAMYRKARNILIEGHHPDPDLAADKILQRAALSSMLASPLQHARVSLLVFWRGFWWQFQRLPTPVPGVPQIGQGFSQWVNLAVGISLFLVFAVALARRSPWWIGALGLPVAMIVIHALLTQGLPRFNFPAIPFMVLAGVACVRVASRWLSRCFDSLSGGRPVI